LDDELVGTNPVAIAALPARGEGKRLSVYLVVLPFTVTSPEKVKDVNCWMPLFSVRGAEDHCSREAFQKRGGMRVEGIVTPLFSMAGAVQGNTPASCRIPPVSGNRHPALVVMAAALKRENLLCQILIILYKTHNVKRVLKFKVA
jgi:hypothetical protein